MRILIANKFWYARGGDCVVAMCTARLLRRMGHEVAVFTMDYPENDPDQHVAGTAPRVDFAGSWAGKWQYLRRVMGGAGVKPAFQQVLHDFDPQVVHLHNVHSYLSPVVAQLAHEHGCRVVWTMHDYKLLCPTYSCLRNGQPCYDCVKHPLEVVNHRCMKRSLPASIAALIEHTQWNINRLQQWVDAFICPSQFMAQKLREADIPEDKIAVLHNFMPSERIGNSPISIGRAHYCCYVGRLSEEKGVATLIEAAAKLPFTIKIAGDGPLGEELHNRSAHCPNVEWLGRVDATQVDTLLRLSRFMVMPSECWEVFSLSAVESLCAGTPVVGTRMGGIPELIDDTCGLLVPPSDPDALATAMQQVWDARWDYAAIARHAATRFDEQQHYRALMAVYGS
ncbi:MAG: glycosyltransferase family 4 protein [Muribaculaceae bacterium]|nr:glycosyltransferase family 4 protein [Muribaculaceae bacterium]